MPRASIRPLRAGGLVALGLLVALAVTGCKRSDDPRLRLKSLNHTTITFQHGTLGHPWDLAYRSRHLSVLVGGLRPFVQLSDSVAELFDLPERLQSRYRSFRYAGQLGFAPYREPFRVGVERFLPVVVVGDRVLEPEF
ncbi:MAG: hypothetical protein KC609_18230, partial [Myxococcales bacterium]|nr:hypothetical protein [Myxococcales bacterium]